MSRKIHRIFFVHFFAKLSLFFLQALPKAMNALVQQFANITLVPPQPDIIIDPGDGHSDYFIHIDIFPSTANSNDAFEMAVAEGHIEVIELFLSDPRVDPTANNNRLLEIACEKEAYDPDTVKVIELLTQAINNRKDD